MTIKNIHVFLMTLITCFCVFSSIYAQNKEYDSSDEAENVMRERLPFYLKAMEDLEKKELENYDEISNNIQRFYTQLGLPPRGDYSKLKFIIRSNKMEYMRGEPIIIRLSVRNDSDSHVNVHLHSPIYGKFNIWSIVHADKNEEVPLTLYGKQKLYISPIFHHFFSEYTDVRLEPGGEEFQWGLGRLHLNPHFDLSISGTYRITCHRTTLMFGQEYDPPLKSNTIEIKIIDKSYLEKETWSLKNFINPPPGEEKFEEKVEVIQQEK